MHLNPPLSHTLATVHNCHTRHRYYSYHTSEVWQLWCVCVCVYARAWRAPPYETREWGSLEGGRVNPDDRVGRRLSPSSHAHTLKRHFAITRTGGKEGDNLSLGKK